MTMLPAQVARLEAVRHDAPARATLFESVYSGKASPRKCIKAFCLDCMGLQSKEITNCTAPACPLYRRPYQRRGSDESYKPKRAVAASPQHAGEAQP